MFDDLSLVVVRPGDRILLAVKRDLTAAEALDFRRALEGRLPGVQVVIVPGVNSVVVYQDPNQGETNP